MGKTKTRITMADAGMRGAPVPIGSASIEAAADPETHAIRAADDAKRKPAPQELAIDPDLFTDDRQQQSEESDEEQQLQHNGNNASIVLDEKDAQGALQTPWTPRSLGRAKSAIIYKHTLNDTLLVLERNIFFFQDWTPYFVSLQEDHLLLFTSRERWEQGLKPNKVVDLHALMLLSDMKVDVLDCKASQYDDNGSSSVRLFRRRLLETDEVDEWINEQLREGLVVGNGSLADSILSSNPGASARCLVEFGSYNQATFELWSKSIRRVLQAKREIYAQIASGQRNQDTDNNDARTPSSTTASFWVSPGQDSKLTLLQSEIWCNRVLSGEQDKAESEIRRLVAMEKLVSQVTCPRMALLVYEKVSRVHELFVANSRREIEKLDEREQRMPAEVLNFFADHLKRKYTVFLILALSYGVADAQIREAHEAMCRENAAVNAGVGAGSGEQQRTVDCYGFSNTESVELYDKYRDAAANYFKMNYGDPSAAGEEDAIMHLPVMLQVSVMRQDMEEMAAMMSILDTVKRRLLAHCGLQQDEQGNAS